MAKGKKGKGGKKGKKSKEALAEENWELGSWEVFHHPMFNSFHYEVSTRDTGGVHCPDDGWLVGTSTGRIAVNDTRLCDPDEWTYVLAHALLHLGFGHYQKRERPWEWNAACDVVVARFLSELKLGRPPAELRIAGGFPPQNEEALYREFCVSGIPDHLQDLGTAGRGSRDMLFRSGPPVLDRKYAKDYETVLSIGLARAVRNAVNVAGGAKPWTGQDPRLTVAERARRWFVNHYPLLGALAASFKIITDHEACRRLDIRIAAVHDGMKEIYVNEFADLNEEECRFVMGHELLHAGLRHGARGQGRDPYLWNVACDFVVNGWLVEMGIGDIPRCGGLFDPELKGESAESVYDRIVQDIRRFKKLATFRGVGAPDILPEAARPGASAGDGINLDEFYRSCLEQGLAYHQEQGRGLLPAGLIEEIRALSVPPIPWDVELARWFDEHFRPIEKVRTYARPSRRQSSTPDIPRPRLVVPDEARETRTYGVVLDTSGSMDRMLLAKALGAIASYSVSRDVPAARVVFCDAVAYDQGYMAPEEIAGRVKVKGRGGTVLQPGVRLLEKALDFPKDAPILIITDGWCDEVRTRRDHAFLLPKGQSLPFVPKGKVFRICE